MDSLHHTRGGSSLTHRRRERVARAEAFKATIHAYHEGRATIAQLRAAFHAVEAVWSSPERLRARRQQGAA